MNKYSLIIANYCGYQAERWWIGEQVDTVLLTYRSNLLKSVLLKNIFCNNGLRKFDYWFYVIIVTYWVPSTTHPIVPARFNVWDLFGITDGLQEDVN